MFSTDTAKIFHSLMLSILKEARRKSILMWRIWLWNIYFWICMQVGAEFFSNWQVTKMSEWNLERDYVRASYKPTKLLRCPYMRIKIQNAVWSLGNKNTYDVLLRKRTLFWFCCERLQLMLTFKTAKIKYFEIRKFLSLLYFVTILFHFLVS